MTSVRRLYGEWAFSKYSYYANFLPVEPVEIGDFGIIEDGAFMRLGSLSDQFGLTPEIAEQSSAIDTFEFNVGSERVASADASASIEVAELNKAASAKINFSKKNGIFFYAAGCRTQGLRNLVSFQEKLLILFAQKKWQPEWVAVTGVVRCGALTLVVGEEAGAGIELRSKAETPISFADVDCVAGLQVAAERKIDTKIIGQKGTPFVRIAAIRRKWIFGSFEVATHRLASDDPHELAKLRDQMNLDRVPIEEKLEFRELGEKDRFLA